jgi:hypothetical protein
MDILRHNMKSIDDCCGGFCRILHPDHPSYGGYLTYADGRYSFIPLDERFPEVQFTKRQVISVTSVPLAAVQIPLIEISPNDRSPQYKG